MTMRLDLTVPPEESDTGQLHRWERLCVKLSNSMAVP